MRRAVLMVLIVGGLVAAGCSSSSNTAASNSSTSSSTASSSVSGTSSSSSSSAASSATVDVATDPKLGKILVGANGKTLYLFAVETGTTSSCTGGCASAWPALTATGTPSGGDGVDASKLGTANGQVAGQVTYNGHLLYFYAGDTKPGDTNGTSIPNWFAVSPTGDKAGA